MAVAEPHDEWIRTEHRADGEARKRRLRRRRLRAVDPESRIHLAAAVGGLAGFTLTLIAYWVL